MASMVGTIGKPVTFSAAIFCRVTIGKAKLFSSTSVPPKRVTISSW